MRRDAFSRALMRETDLASSDLILPLFVRPGKGVKKDVNLRAIFDDHERIMVLITHNTDFGDSYEREGDNPDYFYQMSVPGYGFGINTLLYAMTH